MVKQKAEPINAMIRSNDGQTIANAMISRTILMRTVHLRRIRERFERAEWSCGEELCSGESLKKPSIVLKIGRALPMVSLYHI